MLRNTPGSTTEASADRTAWDPRGPRELFGMTGRTSRRARAIDLAFFVPVDAGKVE